MSPSHGIKGGTTDEAFKEQCFLLERGVSVDVHFELWTFNIFYMYKNLFNTLKDRKMHKQTPLIPLNIYKYMVYMPQDLL